MTNHTVSAAGGNEVTTYAISAGYYYEDGMVDPEEYSRYNLRAAVDIQPKDYLKFGINLYGAHTVRNTGTGILTTAMRMRPTYHPTNLVTGEEETKYSNGRYNPLLTQKNATNKNKNYNMMGNLYLEILPVKNLSLKTTLPIYVFMMSDSILDLIQKIVVGIWQIVIMQKIVIPIGCGIIRLATVLRRKSIVLM